MLDDVKPLHELMLIYMHDILQTYKRIWNFKEICYDDFVMACGKCISISWQQLYDKKIINITRSEISVNRKRISEQYGLLKWVDTVKQNSNV